MKVLTTAVGINSEKDHHSMDWRWHVIHGVQRLFAAHRHFNEINQTGRQKIAGLVEGDEANYLWFGSMKGAGKFWQAINNNDQNLSQALDLISTAGEISR